MSNQQSQPTLPPALVREVAAKVLALWQTEQRILQERKRKHGRTQRKR